MYIDRHQGPDLKQIPNGCTSAPCTHCAATDIMSDTEAQEKRRTTSQRPAAKSAFFTAPEPIQKLFNKVPLVTYPANELPHRSRRHTSDNVLYIFTTEAGARMDSPSFNPGCLKWQVRRHHVHIGDEAHEVLRVFRHISNFLTFPSSPDHPQTMPHLLAHSHSCSRFPPSTQYHLQSWNLGYRKSCTKSNQLSSSASNHISASLRNPYVWHIYTLCTSTMRPSRM